MSKLLSMLIASLFAAGAAVAQGTSPDYGKAPSNTTNYNNTGATGGAMQHPAYPTNNATGGTMQHPASPTTAATGGTMQHPAYPTTAANDKDKADKADKVKDKDKAASGTQYAPQQQMGAGKDPYARDRPMADKDKMKDKDKAAYGDQKQYPKDQHMADRKDKAVKHCPPGLARKDNGCMPPGQARKHDDTHVMGNKARDRDDREHFARNDDRDDHRRHKDRKHQDRDRSGSNSGRH